MASDAMPSAQPVASRIIVAPPSTSSLRPVRLGIACVAALLVALLAPAAASAELETFALRYGPVELGGYQTKFPEPLVKTPRRAGYIVRMNARIVDSKGKRIPLGHVMLHHVVFINTGKLGGPRKESSCPGRAGEPFYGTGEERQRLLLPPGYGYRVEARERWKMVTMLMSHRLESTRVWVEYTVTMETSKKLTPVRPLWLRASGCDPRSSYTIDGGGPPGSTDARSADWPMPISGRIVAAGAHLHGSAKDLILSQPRCGDRTLIDHRPRYGAPEDPVYQVRPRLHEPGPIATGYYLSSRGIPVTQRRAAASHRPLRRADRTSGRHGDHAHLRRARRGRASRLRPASRGRAHPLVAAARPRVRPAGADRADRPGRARPPDADRARGRAGASSHRTRRPSTSRNSLFTPPSLSIALGGTVTWRSLDVDRHVVFLANGPRAVDCPLMRQGAVFAQRFTVPGTYNLFCYLHPVTMHQTVTVRPGA